MLIEGIKLCQEAVAANVLIDVFLFCPQLLSSEILTNFVSICEQKSIPYYELSLVNLQALSDTVHAQGVICVIQPTKTKVVPTDGQLILAVDAVNDPGNLGTIIRTADWFGVDAILVGENSVELYNEKVIRATMGSIFHLPILININLKENLQLLKKSSFVIYAAAVHGSQSSYDMHFASKKILVVGNESHGVNQELLALSDIKIKIPARGKAESLNMAVATGIILSQMVR